MDHDGVAEQMNIPQICNVRVKICYAMYSEAFQFPVLALPYAVAHV